MIALTGAAGKTGTALSTSLDVRGIAHVRLSSRRGGGDRHFDWTDRSTWPAAFDGVDSVYLVKPPHGTGMADLVSALLQDQAGIDRVVLLSEMGRGEKPAADADRAVELVVESWKGRWTVLRPSWFFQNFSTGGGFHDDVMAGTISIPTGGAPVSWIDTGDIAEAAVAALTEDAHGGRAYTLTGGESFGVDELARRIGSAVGRPVAVTEPLGTNEITAVFDEGTERSAYYAELLVDVSEGRYGAITNDTAELIGRAPRTLDDFVQAHINDWK